MNAASPVETLVTDHLDLWTAALKRKSTAGRGSSSKVELYGIKKLRELILELAVRGLLVPQDPSDEPASELLKKIAAEKAKLIKEGKIKKEKPLPPIRQQDEPFDLPSGWKWALLPQICSYGPGKTPSTKNSVYWEDGETGIPWVSISDMEHLRTITNTTKRITQKAVAEVFRGEPVSAGTMLMSFKLTLGKISKLGVDAYHNEAIISLRPYAGICEDYVFNFLPGRASAGNSKAAIKGDTLNSESLAALLIPLPPTAEQHRIVAKVDELMALCDQLEQETDASLGAHQTLVENLLSALTSAADHAQFASAWQRIAGHFDTLFTTEESIAQLKQTILQLAVMGKLVPQDPNDEPASELLKKIAAEKAKLVKEGKIKKDKRLLEIAKTEVPFGLPSSWECVGLQTISLVGTGATPARDNNAYYDPPEFSWVTSGETSQQFVSETREKISAKAVAETNVTIYPPGTLIVAMYGQGKTRGQITELLIPAGTNQACAAIQLIEQASAHRSYIKIFFQKAYEDIRSLAEGGAQPNLNVGKISETVIPLPPLSEQHRIVAKVDELMALCDQLKSRLSDAQTTQLHLADALVERAIC